MPLEEATAKGLTQRPTRLRPARPMQFSKLARMLHNKYYIGVVTYQRVEYQGKHPPLVSRELFNKVQQISRLHDLVRRRRTIEG